MTRHLALAALWFGGVTLFSFSTGRADEGMWPLDDLHTIPWDSLQARGLTLAPDDIYNPDGADIGDAVISLGGGSASFVSPNGLIITNHHVAFTALQRASTTEHNYVRDGFFARTLDEEIPAVGYNVFVTLGITDVTERVTEILEGANDELSRYNALDSITKVIVAEAEREQGVVAELRSMMGGTEYALYTFLKISDVRIVHAPPDAIGEFGGDIDNWMWPRHTGDYSFLRAYVGPDGAPADYSPKNVPYRPKSYLTVSKNGFAAGDCTVMLGYPGRTNRHASSYEIDETFTHGYVRALKRMKDLLGIIERSGAENPEVALRLSSTAQGLNNYYKKTEGLLEGFRRDSVLARRQRDEKAMAEFLRSNPEMEGEFGGVLASLDSLFKERGRTRDRREVLDLTRYTDYLGLASSIYEWVKDRDKTDLKRDMGYQDRDSLKVIRKMEYAQINLVPEADREFLTYLAERALSLPAEQRLAAVDRLFAGVDTAGDREAFIAGVLDGMYARSRIGRTEDRLKMMHMTREELLALDDPFIDLAAALSDENEAMETADKRFEGALSRLQNQYIRARLAWGGGAKYPDANGTKRFNFGEVKGYSSRDAITYDYLTSLSGVIEKEQAEEPFLVPPELKKAHTPAATAGYIDPHRNDVPVNFTTTNDGTNGNSGSPVLDGQGRLIGLDFDTNLESVVKDYHYNATISRAIVVDIRYVLFLLDRVYGMTGLLEEMRIE